MYNYRNFSLTPRTLSGFIEGAFQNGVNRFNEELSAVTTPVNIKETDAAYELHVAAPGLKKEEFKVSVDRHILTIAYEHKEETKQDGDNGKWLRNEFRSRSFKRSFTLNEKVDASGINAKYTDGILNITLPKKEESTSQKKEIEIE